MSFEGRRAQREPSDPAYADKVRESFARQRIMSTLGASLSAVEPGRVEIRLPFRADLTQQHGFLHAGVLSTILDSACGYAALTLLPADGAVLAVEFKVNFLAPAEGEAVVARASVMRSGRTVSVCRADAYAQRAGEEVLVATMLGTILNAAGRGLAG